MYQVLYRKWRPEKFSDVSGQPQVTKTLKNEIKNGRINHAYLFTGSRGTGKTTCAKILAKAVNCLDSHDGEPCGKCQNCIDFQEGNLLDVVEMDAASNRGIEDIRVLIEESAFSPSKGKYRVYIIDEVHMLTEPAFNALLKTLEEPPAHVVFILATTEVHKLPQTILSRCQRFDFHRIAPEDIADRLMYVAQQENVTITKEAALLTAVIADGAMRDSLSIMDRCIGISRDIDADVVRKAAGLAQKDYLFSLSSACINKNVQKALSIIDKLHSESMDMARLCAELIDHFRNFMLIKTVRNPREMIVMNDDEFEEAQSQCDYVSLADVVYFMDVLQRSAERMGKSSSNRTEIETALVKLTSPELDVSQEALTARLVKLEKAVNMGGFSKERPIVNTQDNTHNIKTDNIEENSVKAEEKPQPRSTPAFPTQETTAVANDLHNKLEEMRSRLAVKEEETKNQLNDEPVSDNPPSVPFPTIEDSNAPVQEKAPVRRNHVNLEEIYANAEPFLRWQEVVENLKEYSRPIAASFDNTDAYVSGDYLLIDAKTDIPFNLLKRSPEQKDRIRDAVQEMTGKRYKLGPYKPPVKKQEKTDPLATFAQKLRDSGVDVTEE
ncbi:MAG: DNA polymerase III subunit gamma/tau [Ruminococcus sp.]